MRGMLLIALLSAIVLFASSCNGAEAPKEIPVTTDFGLMLRYIPVTYLEERDLWFGDVSAGLAVYGVDSWFSFDDIQQYSDELQQMTEAEKWQHRCAYEPMEVIQMLHWYPDPEMKGRAGFDHTDIERLILVTQPGGEPAILKGSFDADVIGDKLTVLGYATETHGDYTYFSLGDDYAPQLTHPVSSRAMASLNRIYISADTVILAPATEFLTGILDTKDKSRTSLAEKPMIRALADTLGDAIVGAITIPERLIDIDPEGQHYSNGIPSPNFDAGMITDWGTLPECDMAAFGWRYEGADWYLDIALAYPDAETAEASGDEITRRMQSYFFISADNLFEELQDDYRFTHLFDAGEPVVTGYDSGVVLRISCRAIPGGRIRIANWMGAWNYRDLLFLSPDPEAWVNRQIKEGTE